MDELSAKLAEIRAHYDRYELAEAEARSVTAAHPADAAALLLLGRVLIARYRPGEALPVLAEAAALAPGDPAITSWRIAALSRLRHFPEALALGTAGPAAAPVEIAVGRLHLDSARPLDALPHLAEAVRLAPDDPGAVGWHVAALIHLHRLDEAEKAARDGRAAPGTPTCWPPSPCPPG